MTWPISALLFSLLLGLLALERVAELRLSRRNAAWALSRGGIEVGQRHFVVMTLLHTAWFGGCLAEVWLAGRPFFPSLGLPMLGLALLAQALRYWAVATLGPRWNVRVIVLPGDPLATGGPYRYLRHPNYLAVVVEGAAVPLIHTAWLTAAAFSMLNAALLAVRIRCEERALGEHCAYDRLLGGRPRLLPARPPEEATPRCPR